MSRSLWVGQMLLAVGLLASGPGLAGTVAVPASLDTTLVEDGTGGLGDGRGPHLRVGRTGQPAGSIRRGLTRFDVDQHVPPRARVTRVTLILHMSGNNELPDEIGVHRVTDAWGEGGSGSPGGNGVPAAPGDATWIDRFRNPAVPNSSPAWRQAGGDFSAAPSAVTEVAGAGYYSWSSVGMVRDVQRWADHPTRNHGWLLLGNESTAQTVKRFDSRDNEDPAVRPMLLIEFDPGSPSQPREAAGGR